MDSQNTKTALAPKRTIELIREEFSKLKTLNDPSSILRKADEDLTKLDGGSHSSDGKDAIFKALTLNEFDNGALLTMAVSDSYKTFGIDLMRKLQYEYSCTTPSEKATAELAALSYIRTLDVQRRLTNYLDIGTFTDIGVHYVAVLSKELDRANRHYLTAIQALRMLKQPPMLLNIRADTAVVGQNQIVQTNNDKPI